MMGIIKLVFEEQERENEKMHDKIGESSFWCG